MNKTYFDRLFTISFIKRHLYNYFFTILYLWLMVWSILDSVSGSGVSDLALALSAFIISLLHLSIMFKTEYILELEGKI